jgi:hypothetical protein
MSVLCGLRCQFPMHFQASRHDWLHETGSGVRCLAVEASSCPGTAPAPRCEPHNRGSTDTTSPRPGMPGHRNRSTWPRGFERRPLVHGARGASSSTIWFRGHPPRASTAPGRRATSMASACSTVTGAPRDGIAMAAAVRAVPHDSGEVPGPIIIASCRPPQRHHWKSFTMTAPASIHAFGT